MSRIASAIALAVLAAVLLAACGGNSYDAGKVEAFLKDSQKGKTRGLAIGEATCPEDVKLTEGVTFQCTLEIAGVKAPYKVKLTNVDADKVTINAEPAKALISTAAAAAFVKSRLSDDVAARVKIRCTDKAEKVIVAAPGTKIGCVVSLDGKQAQAVLVVDDTEGRVHLQR